MYLNAKEIKRLAEYALGITIEDNGLGVDDSELEDFEYLIESNVDVQDDDGKVTRYRHTVKCDGCDSNEVVPIS
ncbi:hypothetical protein [Vibrio anguillarum]|uniref:Uncharacterized protein n=1 Tax=Vibrio anguillarum TaxID=55601 RepID=A0A7U6FS01_VIBAN|nr:hypothetical protein [Vibrio anguillarum]AZS26234.1 hypothetical protein DYL72_15105 [Vibrio anguillarum]AZS26387.1 hypothetical protein DYL72_15905 [Vibrio anguillarum]MBF4374515.1 hypothetical protein [Vibrio anguillarum]